MEEAKEEKIELKSITADGESPPTTKVSVPIVPAIQALAGGWQREGARSPQAGRPQKGARREGERVGRGGRRKEKGAVRTPRLCQCPRGPHSHGAGF